MAQIKWQALRNSFLTEFILILSILLCFTFIYLFPVLSNISDNLPRERYKGDIPFHIWNYEWIIDNIKYFPAERFFNANIFYPHNYTLAYSDLEITNSLQYFIFKLITDNKIASYNLLAILNFILTGLAFYLFLRILSLKISTSIIMSAVFTFLPSRTMDFCSLPVLSLQWFILSIMFFYLFLINKRLVYLILTSIFFIFQILTSLYLSLFLLIIYIIFVLINLLFKSIRLSKKEFKYIFFILIVTLIISYLFLWPYFKIRTDREIYPRELKNYLILKDIFTSSGHYYPCTLTFIFFIYFWMLRIKQRDKYDYLFAASIVSIILFLLIGTVFSPFLKLPIFKDLKELHRCGIPVILFLFILSAIGLDKFISRLTKWKYLSILLIIMLNFSESYKYIRTEKNDFLKTRPAIYSHIKSLDIIIEYPLPVFTLPHSYCWEQLYMYYSIDRWYKLFNGYSSFIPIDFFKKYSILKTFPSQQAIDLLKEMGIEYIIIHTSVYDKSYIDEVFSFIDQNRQKLSFVVKENNDILIRL
ncbi:MAG: hypothetical protein AB1765_02710 [Candidatus Hydrogenedentota bacterium]